MSTAPIDYFVINRFREGDETAFTTIHNRFFDRMYFFACKLGSPETAEEAVNQAFLSLWEKRDEFPPGTNQDSLLKWLYTTVRFISRDTYVKEKSIKRIYLEYSSLWKDEDESILFKSETEYKFQTKFRSAISSLPSTQKEVIIMSLTGLKPSEIAKELKLTPQSVMNAKSQAIKELRKMLSKEEFLVLLLLFAACSHTI